MNHLAGLEIAYHGAEWAVDYLNECFMLQVTYESKIYATEYNCSNDRVIGTPKILHVRSESANMSVALNVTRHSILYFMYNWVKMGPEVLRL